MNSKLRVVWICHFSNLLVRSRLPLSLYYEYADRGPWITQMINQFKNFEDIELHVISPHIGLKKGIFAFSDENINYYFYRSPFAVSKFKPLQLWAFRLNKLILFFPNRFLIRRIFNAYINFSPDIINLIGFENPQYSSGVLSIKHLPVIIFVQGIYSDPERFKYEKEDRIRSFLERKIIRRHKYYCIGAPFFSELIHRDRKDAIYFWNFFPRDLPAISAITVQKKYDFVFFSRIAETKGIECLIDAMVMVKKVKPDVSLLVMGVGDPKFKRFIVDKSNSLGLCSNITFLGHQKTMQELHTQASKARFYVLPARLEGMAGSILESMYMGLPVVTTNVGGLPYLNKDGETVLMSEPNNIEALAGNMIRLLHEPELAERLILAAKSFVEKEFNHFNLCRKLVTQYLAVIDHYNTGKQIDRDLLFTSIKSGN